MVLFLITNIENFVQTVLTQFLHVGDHIGDRERENVHMTDMKNAWRSPRILYRI